MSIKVGCCGFPVNMKNYFKKLRLSEVQKTFYQPPRPETAQKWRDDAPEDFEFTLKAWQLITHEADSPTYRKLKTRMSGTRKKKCGSFKPTDEVFKAWEETEKIASILNARVIVFQCPASFTPIKENKDNIRKFFRAVKRNGYIFAWEPRGEWGERDIKGICEELDIVHCVDPFSGQAQHGEIKYFRLHGIGGYKYKYTGWDLKRLRDFCETETAKMKKGEVYALFNNTEMMHDALRFEWIIENTGRIKEINTDFLKSLCHEIECREEDEKVEKLSREAERIVTLILHTDYAKVDIEIEKEKLRGLCKKLFPDKEHLYDMIYGYRFDRLWKQFRENKKEE
jgi:uncharacterized protein YecE (DUF72 family)